MAVNESGRRVDEIVDADIVHGDLDSTVVYTREHDALAYKYLITEIAALRSKTQELQKHIDTLKDVRAKCDAVTVCLLREKRRLKHKRHILMWHISRISEQLAELDEQPVQNIDDQNVIEPLNRMPVIQE